MRTLIIACGATKRPDAGLMPAIDRYDGPSFRTLRANRAGAGELRVFILSAEHGLIGASTPIADYDRRMTPARAAELAEHTTRTLELFSARGRLGDEIFVYGGATYRGLVAGALEKLGLADCARYSSGGIGEQLGQLKAFLGEPARDAELKAAAEAFTPREAGQ